MGFGRKDEMDSSTSKAQSSGSGSSSGKSGFGNLTAFIDQGSEFEGKLSFKDTVRIDGRFSGEISSENTLIVGESGQIEANIHSPSVVISGSVQGDIHATQQLVLYKTARLTGDITTPNLVMEEGATLNGVVKMQKSGAVANPDPRSEGKANQKQASANPSGGSNASHGSNGSK